MSDKKILKNTYYLLSLACYLVAILFFTKSKSNGMGVLWMLIGTTLIFTASALNKKSK